VTGPDRATWLNGLLTCDVAQATQERSVWGLLLSKQGKIQADLILAEAGDELIVGVRGGDAEQVLSTLDRYLVMEDAEISAVTEPTRWVALLADEGPVEKLARGVISMSRFLGQGFWSASFSGGGSEPRASLDSALGWVDSSDPAALEEALGNWGRELSETEWETQRLAWGLPVFGVDFSTADNPHEASLERRTVDWQKGCYLGQEVVCMQDMRGKVKRRLMCLHFDGEAPAIPAAEESLAVLDAAGLEVGRLTSSAGRLAIASLKTPSYEQGTQLLVEGHAAVVSQLGAF
jgi:hypothetical protein